MERRFYYIIGVLVLIIMGGIGFFLFDGYDLFLRVVEGECHVISENDGSNKVEIVFFTNNASRNEVEEYADFLIDSKPFSDSKEKFNFYYAGEADCEIIQEKAVYCYSRELLRKSSVCPNDFVVVLSDQPKKIRSSAYMNVMSLNLKNYKSVMLHEFAHVFTNLADEYIPSTIPWDSGNCKKSCEDFEKYGDLEGCYSGCSEASYFRSSENSVMRTVRTNNFGKLNTLLISEDLEEYD